MTGPDRPTMRDPHLSGGLEVWLTGTRAELTAALHALHTTGRIAYGGRWTALTGADTGRWRAYLRIAVPLAATSRPSGGDATLFDLPTRHTA
jgi:hypothetical protein